MMLKESANVIDRIQYEMEKNRMLELINQLMKKYDWAR